MMDARPSGVRPEHFSLSDDGAEAEVQVIEPAGSSFKSSQNLAVRTSSRFSANAISSSRAKRSGLSQIRGSFIFLTTSTGKRLSNQNHNGRNDNQQLHPPHLGQGRHRAAMASGALTGPAARMGESLGAECPWKPEKDAKLSMLRWKYSCSRKMTHSSS